MSAVLESTERFPGAPRPDSDGMSRFERECAEAVGIVADRLGPIATPAVRNALTAAYTLGRFGGVRLAAQVRK